MTSFTSRIGVWSLAPHSTFYNPDDSNLGCSEAIHNVGGMKSGVWAAFDQRIINNFGYRDFSSRDTSSRDS